MRTWALSEPKSGKFHLLLHLPKSRVDPLRSTDQKPYIDLGRFASHFNLVVLYNVQPDTFFFYVFSITDYIVNVITTK